ncbi:CsgG/HfaB family protein [Fodinibius salsisoli]|uniref:Outer membrane beta-barrel protein n=1 Tax=Fodinibius salsisoli TaxID=2820877 RepID=A0ABT3PN68_9BACT|nr:CsgG/HfaB family protein [Fodinibius salsisoli]MCW9707168.1 outer membrane beta-barrel protein [Fodinibius salsisoli]
MKYLNPTYLLLLALLTSSCAGSLKPYKTEPAQVGWESKSNQSLKELPKPNNKVVAAVYRFRDQTGQYKPSQQSISYSTAVTQGATSILIKAMENSGWFTPIEREGISNLLNERRIIQNTRQQNNDNTKLPPLLFAGVVLEGGIIGYDSNVMTGGAGVRYLGMSASGQYRKDQVTIYLRAVSTQSGRILKTVHTTKSILSTKLDGGIFRYVDANELLESEVGVTFNEPPVMAVTEAIDEAVKRLIVEGVDANIWQPADQESFKEYKEDYELAVAKQKERQKSNYYGIAERPDLRSGFSVNGSYSFGSYIGSFGNESQNSGFGIQAEQAIVNSPLSMKFNYHRTQIGSQNIFSEPVNNLDVLINAYLTPKLKLSPYVGVGGGVLAYDSTPEFTEDQFFPTLSGEAGLDYRFSETFGLKIGLSYRYLISDGVDGIKAGSIHDQQWNIMTGFTFYP